MARVKGEVSDVIDSVTKPAKYMMKKLSSAFPLPDSRILKSKGDGDGMAVAKKNAIKRRMNQTSEGFTKGATRTVANGGLTKKGLKTTRPYGKNETRNPEFERKQGNR